MKNMDWYHSLNQPPLSPPDWLFAPVWSILYILMFVSLIIILKNGNIKEKAAPLTLFGFQLIFNLLWTPTFFVNKNPPPHNRFLLHFGYIQDEYYAHNKLTHNTNE